MKINIFGKKEPDMREPLSNVTGKDSYTSIDLNAYNNNNKVGVPTPPTYSFSKFMDDMDRVTNPKPPKNTDIIGF